MSRPVLSVKHVESRELLPKKLTRGRAYFVDSEQIIIIDHGHGPVEYGGVPGPQGESGEPIPQLQEQLNDLAQTSMTVQNVVWEEIKLHREDTSELKENCSSLDRKYTAAVDDVLQRLSTASQQILDRVKGLNDSTRELIANIREDLLERLGDTNKDLQLARTQADDARAQLQEQNNYNADAVLTLTTLLHQKFNDYDKTLNTIIKAITALYPEHYGVWHDTPLPFEEGGNNEDPLDNETLKTDAGAWTIQQTTLEDGTIVLELTAQEFLAETLTAGDTFSYDGVDWTVKDCTKAEDGTITLTITQ